MANVDSHAGEIQPRQERTDGGASDVEGFLKISLVNIPVRVFPATDAAATISFNQLHAECQTRIQQKRWCPKCEREVPNSELVKGYEFEKGRYVVMTRRTWRRCVPSRRA